MTKSAPAWEMTWCGNRVFPLNRGALRLLGRSRRSNPPGSPAMLPHPSGARSNPVPASPPTRRSQLKATKKRSQPSQRIDAESRRLAADERDHAAVLDLVTVNVVHPGYGTSPVSIVSPLRGGPALRPTMEYPGGWLIQ